MRLSFESHFWPQPRHCSLRNKLTSGLGGEHLRGSVSQPWSPWEWGTGTHCPVIKDRCKGHSAGPLGHLVFFSPSPPCVKQTIQWLKSRDDIIFIFRLIRFFSQQRGESLALLLRLFYYPAKLSLIHSF